MIDELMNIVSMMGIPELVSVSAYTEAIVAIPIDQLVQLIAAAYQAGYRDALNRQDTQPIPIKSNVLEIPKLDTKKIVEDSGIV